MPSDTVPGGRDHSLLVNREIAGVIDHAALSVTEAKLAAGAVATAKIGANQVTAAKLASPLGGDVNLAGNKLLFANHLIRQIDTGKAGVRTLSDATFSSWGCDSLLPYHIDFDYNSGATFSPKAGVGSYVKFRSHDGTSFIDTAFLRGGYFELLKAKLTGPLAANLQDITGIDAGGRSLLAHAARHITGGGDALSGITPAQLSFVPSQVVYDNTLAAAAQYVDITGLDGDAAGSYRLIIKQKEGSGTAGWVELFVNGDNLSGSYHSQMMWVDGATQTNVRYNLAYIGFCAASAGSTSFVDITRDGNGHFRACSHSNYLSGASVQLLIFEMCKTATTTNITSLRVASEDANGFAVGTHILLIKEKAG